jgi:hypothetical protein
MTQEVQVSRTLIPAPTPDRPDRQVYQIEYRAGGLPPHFVYIDKAEWTEKKEAEAIKADLKKIMERKQSTITI